MTTATLSRPSAVGTLPPTWSTWREALAICTQRRHLRKTTTIALVIGTTFVTLNQLGAILAGQADVGMWARAAITYVVPFCVSNYSILIATRRQDA